MMDRVTAAHSLAMQEKDKQIAKLEKQLATYKALYKKKAKFLTTTLKRLDESSWENEQDLKVWLKKYGGHTAECASLKSEYEFGCFGIGTFKRDRKCDCGWAKIEKELS